MQNLDDAAARRLHGFEMTFEVGLHRLKRFEQFIRRDQSLPQVKRLGNTDAFRQPKLCERFAPSLPRGRQFLSRRLVPVAPRSTLLGQASSPLV